MCRCRVTAGHEPGCPFELAGYYLGSVRIAHRPPIVIIVEPITNLAPVTLQVPRYQVAT